MRYEGGRTRHATALPQAELTAKRQSFEPRDGDNNPVRKISMVLHLHIVSIDW